MHRILLRRSSIPTIGLAALAMGACALEKPFERVNPLDPAANITFVLDGPDSAHSLGELVQLTLTSQPAIDLTGYARKWIAYEHIRCAPPEQPLCRVTLAVPAGEGAFTTVNATADYREVSLVLELDRRVVGHQMLVGQRAVRLDLSCSAWTLPEDSCGTPLARDSTQRIHTRMFDAGGAPLTSVEFAIARGQIVSRNPLVVEPLPLTPDLAGIVRVRGVAPGSTWVVVRMDAATDSVRITVVP